mmetsp:Transcript_6867/g.10771  ORF Transcript_6867/g.10771 Transcript_6867/m.10771 type:complete len:416 (-) Transcript_6867:643-1890(-)|eukprot:CAMPEP_0184653276 /NCGR_PEP_ID=MMETSP0308-20130426/10999_1 /TAXON_ID=38269 /ORGANISM="Gloeochaete witrockiana, Strain SAG 46.84" /LENGTH=415 /DNA_ID=CAMNT_0027088643 /DNA_START=172 /DNA_END=1419 /DNA_ORIENTATION=-
MVDWKRVKRYALLALAAVVVIIAAWLAIQFHALAHILETAESIGKWAYALLGAVLLSMTAGPLPGYTVMCAASGFILGLPGGFALAASVTVGGSAVGFLAGRRLLKTYVEAKVKSYPRFHALYRAVETGGIKIVVLFRMIPLPYGVINLFLSATPISFWVFISVTTADLIRTLLDVWLGSQARDIHDVLTGQAKSSPQEKAVLAFSLIGTVAVTIGISIFIGRTLRKHKLVSDEDEKQSLIVELQDSSSGGVAPDSSVQAGNILSASPVGDIEMESSGGVHRSDSKAEKLAHQGSSSRIAGVPRMGSMSSKSGGSESHAGSIASGSAKFTLDAEDDEPRPTLATVGRRGSLVQRGNGRGSAGEEEMHEVVSETLSRPSSIGSLGSIKVAPSVLASPAPRSNSFTQAGFARTSNNI